MTGTGWRFERVVAVVEAVCAVALVVVGVWAGSGSADWRGRLGWALIGLAGGAWLGRRAARSWRSVGSGPRVAAMDATTPAVADPVDDQPVPDLTPGGERDARRVLGALGAAGVLAPEVPDLDDLREALADHGEPIDADTLLSALGEADWWRPGLDLARSTANVVRHDSHVEQDADTLRVRAADVLRLLDRNDVGVEVELGRSEGRAVPTRLRITGAGDEQVVSYTGDPKYLSTYLHVALARALRVEGRPRLAWLWGDQGVWLSVLADGAVERLAADLGPAGGEGWAWVDEQEPFGAGEA